MRILITGAAGQIGLDLIRALGTGEDTFWATDIVPRPPAADGVSWMTLDVTDPQQVAGVFRETRPEVVFHFAAMLSARAEHDPQTAYAVNQNGTLNVLEACRQLGIRQLIFPSSIAAYGPGLSSPVADDAPTRPATIYGVTKVSGELLGEYYVRRYGLDFRGVRFPGLINASRPGGGTSDYAQWMYLDAVAKGHYEAFCRPDTRIPLMYMPDAIRALLELSQAPQERLSRRMYNIAAFSPTAREIADAVMRAVPGAKISFRPDPVRQAILDSWPRELDDSAAARDWGWHARYDLAGMTEDLIPRIRDSLQRSSRRPATSSSSP